MIIDAFKAVMKSAFDILSISFTIDSFTISLWHVMLLTILISIVVYLVGGLFE